MIPRRRARATWDAKRIAEVRRLAESGMSTLQAAKQMGLTKAQVSGAACRNGIKFTTRELRAPWALKAHGQSKRKPSAPRVLSTDEVEKAK